MSVQEGLGDFGREPVDRAVLERISTLIPGPDEKFSYVSGPVGMLHCAYKATMDTPVERQPVVAPSGIVLTWDGRLDNRDELLRELSPLDSVRKSDLAIVIAAYERWGTSCFQRLRGDWAVSIWNPIQQILVLAK